METVQANRGQFDFSQADSLLEFAKQHQLRFRAHPLVSHRQLPRWVIEAKDSEIEEIFDQHIISLVNHYRGQVASWDVVNEAFFRNGDY